MGKFNFGVSSDADQKELGEGFYSGDCPPKGNYTVLVKQAKVKKNVNDDSRLSVLLEVQEAEGSDKAQFNGYGFWHGMNVTDQSMPWVNNFLDAIGADRKKFKAGDVTISNGTVDKNTAQDVLKIGTRKVTGHVVRVSTKVRPYQGEDQLDVIRYLLDEDADAEDVTPDDDAAGLDDADESAEDDTDAGTEEDGEESDLYTEADLKELAKEDLQAILTEWEVPYAEKATVPTLIKAILKAQEVEDEPEEAEEESAEEGDDSEESEDLTEEDMAEMSLKDLSDYIAGKGWPMPKKKIPSALRAAILQYQSEPPF